MARPAFPKLEGAPYFNFEVSAALIKGSYDIIPMKPLGVGNERQLVMDSHVVDSTWNCFRKVHQPDKHPDNPLIPGGDMTPEGYKAVANWGTVAYDEEMERFRFWTSMWDSTRPDSEMDMVHVYWESRDGIEWTAPNLGLVEYDGSKENNITQGRNGYSFASGSVLKVPERLWSKGRYAMSYGGNDRDLPPGRTHSMENRVAWSEDGIHWEDQAENPVFVGRNDTFTNMVYDEERDVFIQYRRATVNAHEIRRFAYTESYDLVSWTQPEVILDADELDAPLLYDFTVIPYHGMYLGMLHPLYGANAGYKTGTRLYRDGHVNKHDSLVKTRFEEVPAL